MSTYAFVDGSSLLSLVESARSYFQIGDDAVFDFGSFFAREADLLARTFFYDAFPDRKPGMDEASYRAQLDKSEALFDRINSYSGVHVKNGVARFRPKRGQEQKGVDILLAIDVYRQAVNGLQRAFLFANDGDFYPVLEALQGTQTRTILKCIRGKTPKYLYELADEVSYINELNVVVHFDTVRDSKRFRVNDKRHLALSGITAQGYGYLQTVVFEGGEKYEIYANASSGDFYAAKGDEVFHLLRDIGAFLKYMEREFALFPMKEADI
ncbi:NYN domain-containing protein [Mesorhizobium sp.]|uniref:NYN domain-containing protein n=1 Tax=Mesorhizobium sp. TaxID=1871066 RepID=UPI000FE987A9|nr:NYN domain-containing protein [Mesorhizobium sp.]RWA62142.1 MAG: NYN domain-containing protein [Mesorhizobium sp.]